MSSRRMESEAKKYLKEWEKGYHVKGHQEEEI
jgi:hypothetical protein